MWNKTEFKGRDELIREIQRAATERQPHGDAPDFMLRTRLLCFNIQAPQAQELFDLTTKTILIINYPDLFTEFEGCFQINSRISAHKIALIYRAFGVDSRQARLPKPNFPIDWKKFDFTAFEELYTQDGNPLWIALKQIIPIGTKTPSAIGRSENIYTPEEKVNTCIQLAEAFKAGCATQFTQKATELFSTITSLLNMPGTSASCRLIKTPTVGEAIKGMYEMASAAYAIAMEYPECLHTVQSAFQPTQNWALQNTDGPLETVVEIHNKVQYALTNVLNLGDWMICNELFYYRNTDYIRLLNAFRSNSQHDELQGKVRNIINCNKSQPAHTTKGQKYEVASAISRYLEGHATWFEVRECIKANPDWNAPPRLFGKEKLIDIVANIETNPVAKTEADFCLKLPSLTNEKTNTIIDRFESQLRGGEKQSKKINERSALTLLRFLGAADNPDTVSFVESIVNHIDEHIKPSQSRGLTESNGFAG